MSVMEICGITATEVRVVWVTGNAFHHSDGWQKIAGEVSRHVSPAAA